MMTEEQPNVDYAGNDVFAIVAKRDEIEEKLKEQQIILAPLIAEGYDKPNSAFVDNEGFPQENLEWGKLTEFREKKREFNEHSADFKRLTVQIEKALYSYHEDVKEEAKVEISEFEKNIEDRSANNEAMVIEEKKTETMEQKITKMAEKSTYSPFATITEITPGSPAAEGGLKVGDVVIEYGEINYLNHDNLKGIAQHTRKMLDFPIRVYFKRMECLEIELSITPKQWAGPGILGCRFEVLKN